MSDNRQSTEDTGRPNSFRISVARAALAAALVTIGLLAQGCSSDPIQVTCLTDADCRTGYVCARGACHAVDGGAPGERGGGESAAGDATPDGGSSVDGAVDSAVETVPDQNVECIGKDKDGYCANIPGRMGVVDCRDDDPEINPGTLEVCFDGKDNDCDRLIDEECGCAPGQTKPCAYTGPKGTLGVGACEAGVHRCDTRGRWEIQCQNS